MEAGRQQLVREIWCFRHATPFGGVCIWPRHVAALVEVRLVLFAATGDADVAGSAAMAIDESLF